MPRRAVLPILALLVTLAAAAISARATTIVVPTDDDLLAASRAVVEGRVVDIRSRRSPNGRTISTYVTLDVSRVLAGDATTGRLVLEQMGGRVGNDFSMVYGSPEYRVGERVVVFLNTDDDGAWHTAFMLLGKYSVVSDDGVDVVVRGNADANVTVEGATTERAPYADFVARIVSRTSAKRASGLVPATPVPAELASPIRPRDEEPHDAFTLMSDRTRWFEPDDGLPVPYKVHYTPFLPDGGMGAVADALAAWSGVPGCSLRLELVDHTDACGFVNDGQSTVSFDDCRGQIDGGGCFGVIAIGGASGRVDEHKTINGVSFVRITDADVVMNNGQETCLLGHRLTIREILTHELGHTIGLGHSSQLGPEPNPRLAEATMYYQLHDDGRGASIKPDDVDGVTFIYPASEVAPSVATETLAPASAGEPYGATLEVANGEAPFVWTLSGGALPAGLELSASGAIAGTPVARGEATFAVTVTDTRGRSASRELSLVVAGPKPIVASVTYKTGKKLTVVADLRGAASVEIIVNGLAVSPPLRARLRANADGTTRISVKGSAAQLNATQPAGTNAVTIVADGAASDPTAF